MEPPGDGGYAARVTDPTRTRDDLTPSGESLSEGYRVGETIAGRYRVVAVLGRGGSAAVYRVHDAAVDEEIAVKILDGAASSAERLRSELLLARRITHKNVCRVFDIVEHRHGTLLAMEYFSGGTLSDRVGRTTAAELSAIAAQILDGLEAAHGAGVVHRDLKPANVLVAADGRVALTDFGVARDADRGEGASGRAGTPAYMAPEQLAGGAVDARTDLYALGLVLHEIALGRLPFASDGEDRSAAVLERRRTGELPPFGEGDARALGPLGPGVRRLLERDPARRPADVAEARAALGLEAGGPAARGSPARPSRRVRAAGVATAIVAVGALAIGLRAGQPDPAVSLGAASGAAVERAPPSAPAQRTLSRGEERIPSAVAWMPDEASVVVESNRTGTYQLWRVALAGAESVPLTRGGAGRHVPEIVGQWLYHLADAADGRRDLVRVPLADPQHDPETVLEGVTAATVAADGAVALLARSPLFAGPVPLTLRAADGTTRTLVAPEGFTIESPRWSPDGTRVAHVRVPVGADAQGAVWVTDRSGESREVARGAMTKSGVSWTPAGRSLVYFEADAGGRRLVAADATTGDKHTVLSDARAGSLPAVSPGGKLSFVADVEGNDLWVAPPGRPLSRVTFLGDESAVAPDWAVEPKALVFLVRAPRQMEIRRVGGELWDRVTARRVLPAADGSISTSSDGRWVAYGVQAPDGARLELAELESDVPPRVLVRAAAGVRLFPPQFRPDGARVGFVRIEPDGRRGVWDVELAGGEPRLVLPDAGFGFVSADGKRILYTRERKGSPRQLDVLLQSLDASGMPAGTPRALPDLVGVSQWRFGATGREVVARAAEGIVATDIESGARRVLATLPPGTRDVDRVVTHPDGTVVCSLTVGQASLVVVDRVAWP